MTANKRSGHKKSTAGCASCKRRHIKCDETRPSCIICKTQKRHCPYLDETAPSAEVVTPTTTPYGDIPVAQSPASTSDLEPRDSAFTLSVPKVSFDVRYIELLQQWLSDTHRIYAFNDEHAVIFRSSVFNRALAHPFLLHGLLANAAFHMSMQHAEGKARNQESADELISKALSAFQCILPNIDSDSIVAAFLFSNIISSHQICACFASIDNHPSLGSFLDRFVRCCKISQGVGVVLKDWWPFLLKTELQPLLSVGNQLRAQYDLEKHTLEFDPLRELIQSRAAFNTSTATETYLGAIQNLQSAYNAQNVLDSPKLRRSVSWAFSWPMTISAAFVDLLDRRTPESIIILAHYTPLLHWRRSCWAVQNAGLTIFRLIESFLGLKWAKWLDWPRQVMTDRRKPDMNMG